MKSYKNEAKSVLLTATAIFIGIGTWVAVNAYVPELTTTVLSFFGG